MPPLHGPRELLCWTRNPSNTLRTPLSILMGRCSDSARRGERSTSRMPSSSLSFCAAVSNCCMAIRKGFRSSAIVGIAFAVAMGGRPSDQEKHARGLCGVYTGNHLGAVIVKSYDVTGIPADQLAKEL